MTLRKPRSLSNEPANALSTKAIRYLQDNPHEELTRRDIAAKFGVPTVEVDDLMEPAIHSRLVVREIGDDGPVFKLKQRADVFPIRPRKRPRSPVKIDYATITIEAGVPIPEPRQRTNQWAPLFGRMSIGDSFQLPREAFDALSHAQYAYRKANPGVRFVVRKLNEEQVRIWRTE
jgi:hypothetical protein